MDGESAGTTPACYLDGGGPTSFDEFGRKSPIFESEPLDDHGRESPVATPRAPRPSEGHGDEATSRPTTARWCL